MGAKTNWCIQKIEKKVNITHSPKKQFVINNGFLVGEVCKLYSWLKVTGWSNEGKNRTPPPQKKKLSPGIQQNPNESLGQKKEFQGKSLAENSENLQEQRGMAVTVKPGENHVGWKRQVNKLKSC